MTSKTDSAATPSRSAEAAQNAPRLKGSTQAGAKTGAQTLSDAEAMLRRLMDRLGGGGRQRPVKAMQDRLLQDLQDNLLALNASVKPPAPAPDMAQRQAAAAAGAAPHAGSARAKAEEANASALQGAIKQRLGEISAYLQNNDHAAAAPEQKREIKPPPSIVPAPLSAGDRLWLEERFAAVRTLIDQTAVSGEIASGFGKLKGGFDIIGGRLNELTARVDALAAASSSAERVLEPLKLHLAALTESLQQFRYAGEAQQSRFTAIDGKLDRVKDLLDRSHEAIAYAALKAEAAAERAAETGGQKAAALTAGKILHTLKQIAAPERLTQMERQIHALSAESQQTGRHTAQALQAVQDKLSQFIERVTLAGAADAQNRRVAAISSPVYGPGAPVEPQNPSRRRQDFDGAPEVSTGHWRNSLPPARPLERAVQAIEEELKKARGGFPPPHLEADASDPLVAAARRAALPAAAGEPEFFPGAPAVSQPRRETRGQTPKPHNERRSPKLGLIVAAIILLLASAAMLITNQHSKNQDRDNAAAPKPESRPSGILEQVSKYTGQLNWRDLLPEEIRSALFDADAVKPGAVTSIAKSVKTSESLNQSSIPGLIVTPAADAGGDKAAAAKPQLEGGAPSAVTGPAPVEPAYSAGASAAQEPDHGAGVRALLAAAERGDAEAQFNLATEYMTGQGAQRDFAAAVRWLTRAAGQNHAPAQYRLASLYERGLGVAKSLAQAEAWYLRAAQRGHVKAMHNYAVLHTGQGGKPANYVTAVKWFSKAAGRGLADSQFNLAILHEQGLGVKSDTVEAYRWFAIAARSGDQQAGKERDRLRALLPAAAILQTDQAVEAWKPAPAAARVKNVRTQQEDAPKPNGFSTQIEPNRADAGPAKRSSAFAPKIVPIKTLSWGVS